MSRLRSFLSTVFSGPRAPYPALPRPAVPICLIGDLHGRRDLLDAMLAQIDARQNAASARLVFLGDMIDRGPDSAGVLTQLFAHARAQPGRVICLMGNHERMMLDFLDAPGIHGARWMSFGGAQTLTSFGVDPWGPGSGRTDEDRMAELAQDLRAAMPPGLEDWLRALPLFWSEGRIVATHAGADPAKPIQDQDPEALLWGHRTFLREMRGHRPARLWRDGIWVVHGHTIVPKAHALDGRIAVDTGAWINGHLSAAWLGQEGLSFLTVQDRQAATASA